MAFRSFCCEQNVPRYRGIPLPLADYNQSAAAAPPWLFITSCPRRSHEIIVKNIAAENVCKGTREEESADHLISAYFFLLRYSA